MVTYRRSNQVEIVEYIDYDFVGCQYSMKSTSGYIYLLFGGTISWKSVKQFLIASYTMAAEFIKYYEASNYEIWLQNFVTGQRIVDSVDRPLKLFCDNKSAVLYSNNNRSSTKSKYIDIKLLVVKEKDQNGQLSIERISTDSMIVDPLTKGLPPKMFDEHTTHMGISSLKDIQFQWEFVTLDALIIQTFFSYFNLWIFWVIFYINKFLVYSHSDFSMV